VFQFVLLPNGGLHNFDISMVARYNESTLEPLAEIARGVAKDNGFVFAEIIPHSISRMYRFYNKTLPKDLVQFPFVASDGHIDAPLAFYSQWEQVTRAHAGLLQNARHTEHLLFVRCRPDVVFFRPLWLHKYNAQFNDSGSRAHVSCRPSTFSLNDDMVIAKADAMNAYAAKHPWDQAEPALRGVITENYVAHVLKPFNVTLGDQGSAILDLYYLQDFVEDGIYRSAKHHGNCFYGHEAKGKLAQPVKSMIAFSNANYQQELGVLQHLKLLVNHSIDCKCEGQDCPCAVDVQDSTMYRLA